MVYVLKKLSFQDFIFIYFIFIYDTQKNETTVRKTIVK